MSPAYRPSGLLRALETIVDPARLARGRAVARSGAVTITDPPPGPVRAQVRGTQLRPFLAEVRLRPLGDDERAAVLAAVTARPGTLTAVAAGRLGTDLRAVLMPADGGDVATDCSCPDPIPVCRHVAAVLHALDEKVRTDPTTLLALRGFALPDVLAAAGGSGTGTAPARPADPFTGAAAPPPIPQSGGDTGDAAALLDPAPWRAAAARAGADRAAAAHGLRRLYRLLRTPER